MFSSRREAFKYARILDLASVVLTILSQSIDGPLDEADVMISTMSPVCSLVSSVTMRWLTLAPTHLLPTALWMR